ncbi:metallophosphoesterase [Burkholderia ubonensis]|uniref:metallophosphoesterase n=1 Tax=Burkholderia ubonensis TaxID=101571 RepID=UPI0009B40C63|nr:metallophosphoesterase [Burkholderia ubonensis]
MKKPYRAVTRYPCNTAGRDFVVGDLHGCFSHLDAQLAELGYDASRDRLFSVGDLVNRGPESPAVLDAVHRHRIKAIRGNHEDMILRWLYNDENAEQLMVNGGEWLWKLTGSPELRAICNFMASLPYAIEIECTWGIVGLLHADAPSDRWDVLTAALAAEGDRGLTRRKVLWQRSRWREDPPSKNRTSSGLRELFGLPAEPASDASTKTHTGPVNGVVAVIVGHTPVPHPIVRGNVINIDTGAVYGGALTIMDLADVPKLLADANSIAAA